MFWFCNKTNLPNLGISSEFSVKKLQVLFSWFCWLIVFCCNLGQNQMNSIKAALWRPILLQLYAPDKLLPISITSIIITDLLKTKFLVHCYDDMPKSLFDNIMLFDGDLHLLDMTIDIFRDEEKECGLDSPRKVLIAWFTYICFHQ